MSTTSSILVPVDFSSKSEIAIRYACEIALATGAEIHFLNVIELPYDFATRIEETLETTKKKQAEKLEKLINDLHSVEEFRYIRMKGRVLVGKIGNEIMESARSGEFDLITVGLGGEHDLRKAVYGSITNNLLLESPVPVFAVSKQVDYRHPRRLIFTTDLRERDVKPIKQMKKFARDLGVDFHVLHIVENGRLNQPVLVKFNGKIAEFGLETELYESTSFLEGIVEFIDGDKQTIVVTTRYRKSFLEWLISKSTARVVAQIANVPLLLIPKD